MQDWLHGLMMDELFLPPWIYKEHARGPKVEMEPSMSESIGLMEAVASFI